MPPSIHYSLSSIHCPAARHYHPTLSIWLSVDPMADKYPGVSPYVYCGNNPIVLKDPDGRTWDKPDEGKANEMIELAQQAIINNTKAINMLKLCMPKSSIREMLINEFEERNSYLSEGIQGLMNMGNNPNYIFHFVESNKEDGGYVTWSQCNETMTRVDIHGYSLSTFWHESKHIQDWLSGVFDGRVGLIFGLITKNDGSKVLGTARTADATPEQLNQYRQAIESSAYRSEFSFDPSDFFNGTLKPAFMISHINGDMGIYDN